MNVTLALPIIRTSQDDGTAFDIAGTGIAARKGRFGKLWRCDEGAD